MDHPACGKLLSDFAIQAGHYCLACEISVDIINLYVRIHILFKMEYI